MLTSDITTLQAASSDLTDKKDIQLNELDKFRKQLVNLKNKQAEAIEMGWDGILLKLEVKVSLI